MTNHPSKYAKDGYRFYRVSTPTFFREFELPERHKDMSESQRKQLHLLEDAAERHGTRIDSSPYQCG